MSKVRLTNADIIRSPSTLANWLAPKIWGIKPGTDEPAEFRLDPWLRLTEQKLLQKFFSPSQEFIAINAPPQCGKSAYCGIFFPMWVLGMHPDTRLIRIGYNDQIVQENGALVRDLMIEYGPSLFGVDVDPDRSAKGEWFLKGHIGRMLSVGIGSSITGKPADVMLIDDVIKNMDEAGSKAVKDLHWKEYHGTIRSRLQPGSLTVISATRFAKDDITGRLREESKKPGYRGDKWEFLSFPAIAKPDRDDPNGSDPEWRDILGRRAGEPLQTRFTVEGEDWEDSHFYAARAAASSQMWIFDCVYQQDPQNPEGGMFPSTKWRYYEPSELPDIVLERRVWDLASTESGGDWSVGVRVGKTADGDYYILDLMRFQKAADDVEETVKTVAALDGVAVPIKIEQERSGSGKALIVFYQRALPNHSVSAAMANGSKEDRARPYSTLQQSGRVYLPKDAPWLPEFITEHADMMGNGIKPRHDDQIDAVAHAINDMLDGAPTEVLDPMLYATDVEAQLASIAGGYFV